MKKEKKTVGEKYVEMYSMMLDANDQKKISITTGIKSSGVRLILRGERYVTEKNECVVKTANLICYSKLRHMKEVSRGFISMLKKTKEVKNLITNNK